MSFIDASQISFWPQAASDTLIDFNERNRLRNSSCFTRLCNWRQLNNLDNQFFEKITETIREKFQIPTKKLFNIVWDQALCNFDITWTKNQPLTAQMLLNIEKAVQQTLHYKGKGAHFDFGSKGDINGAARYLLGQDSDEDFHIETDALFEKDPFVLAQFRAELFAAAKRSAESDLDEFVKETYVKNILSLLPFTYPEKGEEFTIPQKIEGRWVDVTYKVDEIIEMSPWWFSSPLPALSLTPMDNPKAMPILAFIGTTYPAGSGFVATLLADCTPFLSVGHAPYLWGRKSLKDYLEKKNVKFQVVGTSLGGALATHLWNDREMKDFIEEVDIFNTANLYPCNFDGPQDEGPKLRSFINWNDLVGNMGTLPTGNSVEAFRVIKGQRGASENFLQAHMKAYTGSENVTILKTSSVYENSRLTRILITILHMVISPLIFLPIFILNLLYRIVYSIFHFLTKGYFSKSLDINPS